MSVRQVFFSACLAAARWRSRGCSRMASLKRGQGRSSLGFLSSASWLVSRSGLLLYGFSYSALGSPNFNSQHSILIHVLIHSCPKNSHHHVRLTLPSSGPAFGRPLKSNVSWPSVACCPAVPRCLGLCMSAALRARRRLRSSLSQAKFLHLPRPPLLPESNLTGMLR